MLSSYSTSPAQDRFHRRKTNHAFLINTAIADAFNFDNHQDQDEDENSNDDDDSATTLLQPHRVRFDDACIETVHEFTKVDADDHSLLWYTRDECHVMATQVIEKIASRRRNQQSSVESSSSSIDAKTTPIGIIPPKLSPNTFVSPLLKRVVQKGLVMGSVLASALVMTVLQHKCQLDELAGFQYNK